MERYRQQLEKAREQPDVMQMKCDRRRMELLGAAAHQESWHERAEEARIPAGHRWFWINLWHCLGFKPTGLLGIGHVGDEHKWRWHRMSCASDARLR